VRADPEFALSVFAQRPDLLPAQTFERRIGDEAPGA
jgi:hypothetical protein